MPGLVPGIHVFAKRSVRAIVNDGASAFTQLYIPENEPKGGRETVPGEADANGVRRQHRSLR